MNEVNRRNATALDEALRRERKRIDDLVDVVRGQAAALETLRNEVATLHVLVHVQRGNGPTVKP